MDFAISFLRGEIQEYCGAHREGKQCLAPNLHQPRFRAVKNLGKGTGPTWS